MEQDSTERDAFQFEGEDVTNFVAQLPAMKLEANEGYPRGTYLTLEVVVRVKSVRHDEDRSGAISRNHVLALDEVRIIDSLTPAQRLAIAEAAERAAAIAKPIEIQEEPGPDAAFVQNQHTSGDVPGTPGSDNPAEVRHNDHYSTTEANDAAPKAQAPSDEDDGWDDEDIFAPGELRVEFVESR